MAWTTPRTWVASEVVDDTIMNAHLRDNQDLLVHQLAYKADDEIVNNSTTVQNDDDLLVAVEANEVWYMNFVVAYVAPAAPDIKFAFTWPTGSDIAVSSVFEAPAGLERSLWTLSGTTEVDYSGLVTEVVFSVEGIFRVGGTAGAVQLQWAQDTLQGVDITVKEGSHVLGCKLA